MEPNPLTYVQHKSPGLVRVRNNTSQAQPFLNPQDPRKASLSSWKSDAQGGAEVWLECSFCPLSHRQSAAKKDSGRKRPF